MVPASALSDRVGRRSLLSAACLLLAAPRRLVEGERLIRSGKWEGWSPTSMIGHRISGKRLGIIGMGRIGQAVARRVQGFGMTVHYHNRRRLHADIEVELEATYWEDLDQMLAHMDFISINCPHTRETHHLLNEDRLKLLKEHAFIVNTARGEIIDEAASFGPGVSSAVRDMNMKGGDHGDRE